MIETTQENGKTYTDIGNISNWNKNPKGLKEEDFFRCMNQVLRLGQYKPLIETPEGVTLGGNTRLKVFNHIIRLQPYELQNYFESELGDDKILYLPAPTSDESDRVKLGKEVSIEDCERVIASLKRPWVSIVEPRDEAQMIEYALSDNDNVGYYEDQKLAELVMPNKDLMPLKQYKVELMKPTSVLQVLQRFGPGQEKEAKPNRYTVVIEVESEKEQNDVYEKLSTTGLKVTKRTM